jgi:hypothetical protein
MAECYENTIDQWNNRISGGKRYEPIEIELLVGDLHKVLHE